MLYQVMIAVSPVTMVAVVNSAALPKVIRMHSYEYFAECSCAFCICKCVDNLFQAVLSNSKCDADSTEPMLSKLIQYVPFSSSF